MKIQSVGLYNSGNFYNVQPKSNNLQKGCAGSELPNYLQSQTLKPLTFGKTSKKYIDYLISRKILPPTAAKDLTLRGDLNSDVVSDLNKLQEAKRKGISIEEAFVPSFYSDKEALLNLKTGDVYKLAGEKNIKIVSSSREPVELGLSREKYMELFPPVKRFCAAQSSKIGNCWFLSALDTMYSNPKTRERILSIFNEGFNGGITINFGGYEFKNGRAYPKDENQENINSVEIRKQNQLYFPEGFAMIENAYETKCRYKASKRIEYLCREFEAHKDDKIPRIEGRRFSKEEIEEFLAMANPRVNGYNEYAEVLIDPSVKKEGTYLLKKNVRKYYDYLNSESAKRRYSKDDIKKLKRMLLRHYEYMVRNNETDSIIDEVMPKELYFNAILQKGDTERYSGFPYSSGGGGEDAFEVFGMKSHAYEAKYDRKRMRHLLSLEKLNSKYIITAGIYEGNDVNKLTYQLDDCHEYSIKPVDKDGKRTFYVKNPHNASHAIPMSLNEVMRHFDVLTFARIED